MTLVARSCWFRGVDGTLLHFDVRDAGETARGAIVTVHGLGEHVAKYGEWFDAAVERGFHAAGYDQRGHGETPGRRGDFDFDDLVADLERFVAVTRDRYPGLPIFLVGHSLGALVSIAWLGRRAERGAGEEDAEPPVAGVALSAPPLGMPEESPGWYRWGIRTLAKVTPGLPLPRSSDPARLTRDPERRAADADDDRIHRRWTPRAIVSTAEAMEAIRERTSALGVPVLLLAAGEDLVVDSAAAIAWARRLEGDVTVERVAGAYHELLNDLGREAVFDRILTWCDERA